MTCIFANIVLPQTLTTNRQKVSRSNYHVAFPAPLVDMSEKMGQNDGEPIASQRSRGTGDLLANQVTALSIQARFELEPAILLRNLYFFVISCL